MPTREEIAYFGAGPAGLPTPVLQSASAALLNYQNTGLGLAEHSHRSPLASQILADTKAALRGLLDVPADYEILFMQAGGSGEFSAVVYNLVGAWVERRRARTEKEGLKGEEVVERLRREVKEELKVDYLVTGSWSLKASQEAARLLGEEHVNVALDARKSNDGKFGTIPDEKEWKLTPTKEKGGKAAPAFVYFCDNETVDGVEFPGFPERLEAKGKVEEDERLVVADMSSNILSRRVDVKKFAVIFAGAQKNVGTTGLTLLILRRSLLSTASTPLLRSLGLPVGPIVLDYPTIAKNNSLYNTLSIFDVWIAGQVMSSLLTQFPEKKVGGMQEIADAKAARLYQALGGWEGVYRVVPSVGVRSRMNICFRVLGGSAEAETKFLKGAETNGLLGLKGHRSVGGIRISNYNSVSIEAAEKLALYIEEFGGGAKVE